MNVKVSIECEALDQMVEQLVGINDGIVELNETLKEIVNVLTPPDASRIIFFVEEGGKLKRIGGSMFQKVSEQKKFAIKISDKFGNDAKVDGAPAWSSSDASLADLAVSDDGMSCIVTPKGPVGSMKLQVNADADLGEGVKPLLGELDLDFVAGDAEVISIAEVPVA